jgi:hypothetical protein
MLPVVLTSVMRMWLHIYAVPSTIVSSVNLFTQYLIASNALLDTNYYTALPVHTRPGTNNDIRKGSGITSIITLLATVPTHALATEAAGISFAEAAENVFVEAAPSSVVDSAPSSAIDSAPSPPAIDSAHLVETENIVESSPSATGHSPVDPVDRAIERAKVTDADPARFSHIYPVTLKSVLERISKLNLTSDTIELGESSSELEMTLGTLPDAVEVTLLIVDSHETAIAGMRQSLSCISVPLDVGFAQTLPLGQYSLQGIGGGGYILFVRGNVFVKMTGLASCEELGVIAAEVDKFLKDREGGFKSLPKPHIPEAPGRVVKAGEIFELTIKVADVGSMAAFTDAGIVQLIEEDVENTTFKFYATAAGAIDIRLLFAHKDTLQTATATVHVEVIDDDSENAQGLEELHLQSAVE